MFPLRRGQLRLGAPVVLFMTSLFGLAYLYRDSIPVLHSFDGLKVQGSNATAAFPSDHETALQNDPPTDDLPFGAVVVAGRGSTNLSWIEAVRKDYSIFAYNVDDTENLDSRLRIPANKGREAMVYLSWIVDNYDNLPWCAFFVHGHATAWHQANDIVRLISGLNRVSLGRAGYISLRCDWYPSCPAEIRPVHHDPVVWGAHINEEATERAIAGNWRQLFPSEKLPETIASPCCAQFAASRQAILRRPKADYERLRDWLIGSLLPDDFSGRVLEKLWAYLFTGNPVHCPPPKQCACEYFTDQCESFKPETPPEGVKIPEWSWSTNISPLISRMR